MFGPYLEVYSEKSIGGQCILLPLLILEYLHDTFFSVLLLGKIPGKILVSLKKERR